MSGKETADIEEDGGLWTAGRDRNKIERQEWRQRNKTGQSDQEEERENEDMSGKETAGKQDNGGLWAAGSDGNGREACRGNRKNRPNYSTSPGNRKEEWEKSTNMRRLEESKQWDGKEIKQRVRAEQRKGKKGGIKSWRKRARTREEREGRGK